MASEPQECGAAPTKRNPKLIGIYGLAGSGKSTVARRLVDRYGYSVVKFAEPLKAMAATLFRHMGFNEETINAMIEGSLKEMVIPGLEKATPRHVMQTIGTEWGRECIERNVWVNAALRRAEELLRPRAAPAPSWATSGVVIDDMRFPNEFEGIGKAGGQRVAVVRPGVVPPNDHPSEGLLEDQDFDVVLLNKGSIENLHEAVDHWMATN